MKTNPHNRIEWIEVEHSEKPPKIIEHFSAKQDGEVIATMKLEDGVWYIEIEDVWLPLKQTILTLENLGL